MSNSELDQVLQQLRNLLAAEYHRGEKDAIARIMAAAQTAPAANGHDTLERESPPEQKNRAPKGTAKALIDRVLRERGSRGAMPSEIQSEAKTDVEKLASFSGIRFALTVGRNKQYYRNEKGKWFWTGKKTVESGANQDSPVLRIPRGDSR
jgi:hypothetical protein